MSWVGEFVGGKKNYELRPVQDFCNGTQSGKGKVKMYDKIKKRGVFWLLGCILVLCSRNVRNVLLIFFTFENLLQDAKRNQQGLFRSAYFLLTCILFILLF